MSVDQPFNIYREQLSSQYHGLALWDPKPVENLYKQPGHVSIGDVGYLDNGAFMRMFNVTLPWDDPSNKLLGEPGKYELLKLSYLGNVRDNEIREGEYYTPHVFKMDNISANRHEDSLGQMYQCRAQHRGALLSLPHKGHRKDVIPIKVFQKYIKENVDNWFRWSKEMMLPVEHMEDLILVTGCTLVTSWAAAAFDGHVSTDSDAITISLETRKSDGGGAQYFWRNIRGNVEYHNSRFEPNAKEPLPQNQCVFIRGFRAKRTFFRTKAMRAAAEPLPEDPDDYPEDEIQVTRIPDSSKYQDPLSGVLDYILEKCCEDVSAAEDIMAIAHDDNLQFIEGVETLTADAVENFLREKKMPLLIENGAAILRDQTENEPPVSDEKNAIFYASHSPSPTKLLRSSTRPPAVELPPGSAGSGPSQFPVQASDILVLGFLAYMFSPEDAHNFLGLLLMTQDFLRHYRMSYSQGVWYIMQSPPYFPPLLPGTPPQNLMLPLDYNVRMTQGTVVPQRRWTPADEIDVRRYIPSASLQLPIFFVNRDGGVGFWLPDILQGRDHDLYNGDKEAPLGGRATVHLRINWPGYGDWKRQIPTRDETYNRNPITRARLMKHVATTVNIFFDQCMGESYRGDPNWRIGINDIMQTHVKIIGAVHVSAGSWMPIVQLTEYVFQGHTNWHTPGGSNRS